MATSIGAASVKITGDSSGLSASIDKSKELLRGLDRSINLPKNLGNAAGSLFGQQFIGSARSVLTGAGLVVGAVQMRGAVDGLRANLSGALSTAMSGVRLSPGGFISLGANIAEGLGKAVSAGAQAAGGLVSGISSMLAGIPYAGIPLAILGNGIGMVVSGLGTLGAAVSSVVGAAGQAFGKLADTVLGFAGAVVGTAVPALAKMGTYLVSEYAKVESVRVVFATMFRDQEAGFNLVADIRKMAASTPFTSSDLLPAGQMLAGYGIARSEILPTLKMLGEVASGVQAPVKDLAYLYGTLLAQGRAYSIDIKQFATRGIPIYEALANVMGVQKTNLHSLIEEGRVGSAQVLKAFQLMTTGGGLYTDMTIKQSQTISGLFSTVVDLAEITAAEVGERFAEGINLRGIMSGVIDWISGIPAMLSRNREDLDTFFAAVRGGVNVFGEGLKIVKEIGIALASIFGARVGTGSDFGSWANGFKLTSEQALRYAWDFVEGFAGIIDDIIQGTLSAVRQAADLLRQIVGQGYGASAGGSALMNPKSWGIALPKEFRWLLPDNGSSGGSPTLLKIYELLSRMGIVSSQTDLRKETASLRQQFEQRRKDEIARDVMTRGAMLGISSAFGLNLTGQQPAGGKGGIGDLSIDGGLPKELEDLLNEVRKVAVTKTQQFAKDADNLRRLLESPNTDGDFGLPEFRRGLARAFRDQFGAALSGGGPVSGIQGGTVEAYSAYLEYQRSRAGQDPTEEQILAVLREQKRIEEMAAKQQERTGERIASALEKLQTVAIPR
jgi:tape measure domain-containing protein